MRGRKKGTKLSEEHKEALRKALLGNTPWNKGKKQEQKQRVLLTPEEKALVFQKRNQAAAQTRKKNTAQKYINEALASGEWLGAEFSTDKDALYLTLTHSCGTIIKVQTQTVRKWNFGASLCKKCNPIFRGVSLAETELKSFIVDQITDDVLSHTKLAAGEVDIFIPSKRLAIEYDGLYWHSDKAGYPPDRHLSKTEECEKLGIQLIHIFEDEFIQKREIVESKLRSLLGKSKRIFARNCVVQEISSREANAFLNETHLQGACVSKIRLGLRDKASNDLVALMTFGKPRFSKAAQWELLRFSTALNITVVGGASKLLAAFKKQHDGAILSYADRRWSTGKMYEALGFKLKGVSAPSYYYFRGDLRHNRQTFQKAKLKQFLGESFDPSKTEVDMMFENGWNRIWDCGNLIYVLP